MIFQTQLSMQLSMKCWKKEIVWSDVFDPSATQRPFLLDGAGVFKSTVNRGGFLGVRRVGSAHYCCTVLLTLPNCGFMTTIEETRVLHKRQKVVYDTACTAYRNCKTYSVNM